MNYKSAIMLMMLFPTLSRGQNVTDSIDKFTNAREIGYTTARPRGTELLLPVFTLRGSVKDSEYLFLVQMVFIPDLRKVGPSKYRYMDCHSVDWLVDDVPLRLASPYHRFLPGARGLRLEDIYQQILPEQIAAIGNASKVQYRVCTDVYSLSATDIQAFKLIAAKIGAQPNSPTTIPFAPKPSTTDAATSDDAPALAKPSGPSAKLTLAGLACDGTLTFVSEVAGKSFFKATCPNGKRQLVECSGASCKPLN